MLLRNKVVNSCQNPNIHKRLLQVPASLMLRRPLVKFQVISTLSQVLKVILLPRLLNMVQHALLLMPPTIPSNFIQVVSTTKSHAHPDHLIMVLVALVMVQKTVQPTGLFVTHGVNHGAKTAIFA